MKKHFQMTTLVVAAAASLLAMGCGDKGLKTTESGLQYRFEQQNKNAQQVQEGDVLVGELVFKFDTMTLFTNVGHPDRVLRAVPSPFDGDVTEGLLMMHVGDKAFFAVDADKMANYMQQGQMPKGYEKGKGQKFTYEFSLQDIVTQAELEEEMRNADAELENLRDAEPELIAKYVADNNITAKPQSNGLYVVVKKKGTGTKVAAGREVAIHYTLRLTDGTVVESNADADPFTYTVGKMSLIEGWSQGIMGQPAGTELQLIIPSALAYGPRGNQGIAPYTPLVFDMKIESVR